MITGVMASGKSTTAQALAERWVARPGTSEHQLGLAVDINGAVYDVYLWLEENSWKYGFIFRWPADKKDSTGCEEDLTVLRYVGSEYATAMQQRSLCLEEYISYLASQG